MFINPDWRILTVGDGDLSFSLSLQQYYQPRLLVASVLDSLDTLTDKYAQHAYHQLTRAGVAVLNSVDVTNPQTWQGIGEQSFDLVVFQFPLIPNFVEKGEFEKQRQIGSNNLLNRRLLHLFLKHAQQYWLDPQGQGLCYISSKDVKPYLEWNLEGSLADGLPVFYQGSMPFEIERFPGYRLRNVDRDKFVKDTQGTTHVWATHSIKDPQLHQTLVANPYADESLFCSMCRKGPFLTELEKANHQQSAKHLKLATLEQEWQGYLVSLSASEF